MNGRSSANRLTRPLGPDGPARILFISNQGAARALIAEAIVNRHKASGFTAVSAGVRPEGVAHPMAQELLRAYRLPAPRSRPISLEEALDQEARNVDYVVALWDRSDGEPAPSWGADRFAASWDVPDPRRPFERGAGIVSSRLGFVRSYLGLRQRIERFFSDVTAERRATLGPGFDGIAPAPPMLQKRAAPANAKRNWSLGGVFSRATSQSRDVEAPLSLGRSQLAPHKPKR